MGHWQRILEVRRKFHPGRIRHRVSPLRHLGSEIRNERIVVHRFRLERRRLGLDVRFLAGLAAKRPGSAAFCFWALVITYSWNLSRDRTQIWIEGQDNALEFEPVDWYELLREGDKLEFLIEGHWRVMAEFDPLRRIQLVVDDWGPWYKLGTQVQPTDVLGQTITLRDAVMTAMTLDLFNRHPDKVTMAACAQLVNCLNSLFIAHGDRLVLAPVYHVFQMYAAHQGGPAVRAELASPSIRYDRDGKPASFWGLKGSASLRDKTLPLTVVNPDVRQPPRSSDRFSASGGPIRQRHDAHSPGHSCAQHVRLA